LAKAFLDGTFTFDSAKGARDTASKLHSILGLEEHTCAYIAMRSLGDPDAFSCGSLAFRRALASYRNPVSSEEVARMFEAFRPWRAYAAMHYWAAMQETGLQTRPPAAARSSSARSIRRRSRVLRRPPLRS
jgi:AraC family transcriptional regulator of adaptative response / DNA-3-methyladenine glycosylase II